jgi:hypothetical protein
VIDRETVHVPDIKAAEAEFPWSAAAARECGSRTYLATPLLREGISIGVITIRRREVRPFSIKEIKLLQTFADQAVIAIEKTDDLKAANERAKRHREATLRQAPCLAALLGVIGSPGLIPAEVASRPEPLRLGRAAYVRRRHREAGEGGGEGHRASSPRRGELQDSQLRFRLAGCEFRDAQSEASIGLSSSTLRLERLLGAAGYDDVSVMRETREGVLESFATGAPTKKASVRCRRPLRNVSAVPSPHQPERP